MVWPHLLFIHYLLLVEVMLVPLHWLFAVSTKRATADN